MHLCVYMCDINYICIYMCIVVYMYIYIYIHNSPGNSVLWKIACTILVLINVVLAGGLSEGAREMYSYLIIHRLIIHRLKYMRLNLQG